MMAKTGKFLRQLAALLLALALCAGTAAAAQDYLIPGGYTVGIELAMRGVLVVDVEDGTCAAEAGLRKGDTIIKINGTQAQNAAALRDAAGEESVVLTVLRDGKEAEFFVAAQRRGRLGLLVRDSLAGIGTVTYVDPETGRYGALGHGVNDLAAGRLLEISAGILVPASVKGVRRGVRGTPGELRGEFDAERCIGTVEANTERGIFGVMAEIPKQPALPVGAAETVREGPASILTNVDGTEVREYAIRIDRVSQGAENGRDLLLTVTDPELLAVTGGIVQGMSGSPILQNGRIIGAVTHVLVNHPEQGYGILIGTMMDAAA